MASSRDSFAWNARMMVFVGLIIIAAWSFNRFMGRSDCVNTHLIDTFKLEGTEKLEEFELCHRNPSYDFVLGQFGEYLLSINRQVKNFTLVAEPVPVVMSFSKTTEYFVSQDLIRIGSEQHPFLARALIERHFINQLPAHPSREIYLDLLLSAAGGEVNLPKSIFFVNFLTREEDYCRIGYLLPQDHMCRSGGEPHYRSFLGALLLRPALLRVWQLYYASLTEENKTRMLKGFDRAEKFPELDALQFSDLEALEQSARRMLEQIASTILEDDLRTSFSSFVDTALRTQFRGGELSVDYLLEDIEPSPPGDEEASHSFVYRRAGDLMTSSLPLRTGLPYKFRYHFYCADESAEHAPLGRRSVLLLNCADDTNWQQLYLGQHEEFLLENENLGFLLTYTPEFNKPWRFQTTAGAAENSLVFGEKVQLSFSEAMKSYKLKQSEFLEFYRPVNGREKLVIEGVK